MAGQVGFKTEVTWGTGVTPDIFVPVLSAGVTLDEGYMRPAGIRAGRFTRVPARLGRRAVGGQLEMELPDTPVATLLKHMFGSVSGSGPLTFTPGTPLAKGLTIQTGVEDAGGTVRPFTASGSKFNTWSISAAVGEYCKLQAQFSAKDIVTATALATASYTTTNPFTFVEAAVTVNGSSVASANGFTLSATKGLKTDRHVLGSRLIREQLAPERFEFTTEITADFDDLTLVNLAVAGTQVASVITLSNGTISLVITCSGQVTGDPPSLASNGLEGQTIKLDHSHATSDASAITAVLTGGETSAP